MRARWWGFFFLAVLNDRKSWQKSTWSRRPRRSAQHRAPINMYLTFKGASALMMETNGLDVCGCVWAGVCVRAESMCVLLRNGKQRTCWVSLCPSAESDRCFSTTGTETWRILEGLESWSLSWTLKVQKKGSECRFLLVSVLCEKQEESVVNVDFSVTVFKYLYH